MLIIRKTIHRLLSPPKFAPGNDVAVCAVAGTGLLVVIPVTRVVKRQLWMKGECITLADGTRARLGRTEYWYTVDGDNPRRWFAESTLRPIRPDEYQEDESVESKCGVVV